MILSKEQYQEYVVNVADMQIFDGRGRGVDVYICRKCGKMKLTRYKDKGVTPFVMPCFCGGDMVHEHTVAQTSPICAIETVSDWVRPTYEQFLKQPEGVQMHVMNGGLVLEEELI